MLRAGLAVGLMGTLALTPSGYAAAADDAEHRKPRGTVPHEGAVRRLDRGPHRCLRPDRHAVPLGRAESHQRCAVHTAVRGSEGYPYTRSPEDVERAIGGISPRSPSQEPTATRLADPRRPWVKGRAFDTCAAPSTDTMRAWRSAFVAANIYIGGAARSCPDGNLSADWVRVVRDMGWRLIPTYVGPQAPCGSRRVRFASGEAVAEGRFAAEDAVARARALGIPEGSPIYYDMEAYDGRDATCRRAVLSFLDAWTRRLERLRYVSGVYSSAASGIRDLGTATGIRKPAAIWFGHWDGRPSVRGDRYLPDSWWPGHRRIKQYRGPHRERHGGVTLKIDSDVVDGLVY